MPFIYILILRAHFICHLRLPFDWKNPIGYLLALIYISTTLFFALSCVDSVLCLAIGSSWIASELVDGITDDVRVMNGLKRKTTVNRQQLNKLFCFVLEDFSNVKELSFVCMINGF